MSDLRIDGNRLERAEVESRLRVCERAVVRAAVGDDRLDRRLLGGGAHLAVFHADVVHAQRLFAIAQQLHQHRRAVEAAREHRQRGHAADSNGRIAP